MYFRQEKYDKSSERSRISNHGTGDADVLFLKTGAIIQHCSVQGTKDRPALVFSNCLAGICGSGIASFRTWSNILGLFATIKEDMG